MRDFNWTASLQSALLVKKYLRLQKKNLCFCIEETTHDFRHSRVELKPCGLVFEYLIYSLGKTGWSGEKWTNLYVNKKTPFMKKSLFCSPVSRVYFNFEAYEMIKFKYNILWLVFILNVKEKKTFQYSFCDRTNPY